MIVKLNVTRSLYVRKPVIEMTEDIVDMFKRLGKYVQEVELSIPVIFD